VINTRSCRLRQVGEYDRRPSDCLLAICLHVHSAVNTQDLFVILPPVELSTQCQCQGEGDSTGSSQWWHDHCNVLKVISCQNQRCSWSTACM